ncbi:hypothetical protein CBL_20089 [Carabus blaptoides fortunei]
MKPIRHHMNKIRDALEEVREETKDPMIKSEAVPLAEHEINFEFVLSTVIWYDLLIAVDKVSKSLQNKSIDVSVATSLLKGLQEYLQSYRENNFELSLEVAKKICDDNDIEAVFKTKRSRKKRRLFEYEGTDTTTSDPKLLYYREYYLPIIDQALNL